MSLTKAEAKAIAEFWGALPAEFEDGGEDAADSWWRAFATFQEEMEELLAAKGYSDLHTFLYERLEDHGNNTGHSADYEVGYSKGSNEGYNEGFIEGLEEGRNEGCTDCGNDNLIQEVQDLLDLHWRAAEHDYSPDVAATIRLFIDLLDAEIRRL